MAWIDDDTDEMLEPTASVHPAPGPGVEGDRPAHDHAVYVHRFASHVLRVRPGVERARIEQSLARALGMKLAEFREAILARAAGRTPRLARRDPQPHRGG